MFGDASLGIHTIVTFDGAFDTFISLPPSKIAAPLPGCVVKSGGLNYEWYYRQTSIASPGKVPRSQAPADVRKSNSRE
jgi:hypothetical protein